MPRKVVHYGIFAPVCTKGMRRKSASYRVSQSFKNVTCKRCKDKIDISDTKHVLRLKRKK